MKEDSLGRKLGKDTPAAPPPGFDQTGPGLVPNNRAAKKNAKRAALKKMARTQSGDSDTSSNFGYLETGSGSDLPIIMEGPDGPDELMPGANNFIRDPLAYQRLLGNYLDSDDDDGDYDDSDGEGGDDGDGGDRDDSQFLEQQHSAGPGVVRVLHHKEKGEEEQSLEQLTSLGKLGPKVWLPETLRKGYAPGTYQVDDGSGDWEEVGGKKQQKPAAGPPPVPAAGFTRAGTARSEVVGGFGAHPDPVTPAGPSAGGWGASSSAFASDWGVAPEPSAADGWGTPSVAEPDNNHDLELLQALKLSEQEVTARAARPSDSDDEQMRLALEASRLEAERERQQQEALMVAYNGQEEARRRAQAEEQAHQQAAVEAARIAAAAEAARKAQMDEYARHQAAMEQARLQAEAASAAAAAAAEETRRLELARQQEYARHQAAAAAFQAQLEEQARQQAAAQAYQLQQQQQAAWYAHVQAQQPEWQQQQLAAVTADKLTWLAGVSATDAVEEADDVDVDELASLLING